jgi:hypothetical protein
VDRPRRTSSTNTSDDATTKPVTTRTNVNMGEPYSPDRRGCSTRGVRWSAMRSVLHRAGRVCAPDIRARGQAQV